MAVEGFQITAPGLTAGGDLSSGQYRYVKLDANEQVIICTAVTDIPIGVLQDTPDASGKAATVCVVGDTKIASDVALSAGWLIGPSTDGQAERKIPGTETTEFICGQVMRGSSGAGVLARAFVNCASPARAQ